MVGAFFHCTITFAVERGSSVAKSGDSLDDCAKAVADASATKPQNPIFFEMVNLLSILFVTERHIDGRNRMFSEGKL